MFSFGAATRSTFQAACCGLLLGTLALFAPNAMAERYALLVGVSNYPALDAKLQLNGPKNDIPLVRSVLERRGFTNANMQVLADGVAGASDPSRTAILAQMDALVNKTKSGDFVFLYFAGHGSQMPADRNTPQGRRESDGLHEIFLPRDVGKWNDTVGAVQNAIINYELVQRLDALTSKGVFVWAVFDACHSATLMRSAGDPEIRYRQIQPGDLGIPSSKLDQAEAEAIRARGQVSASAANQASQGAMDISERGTGTPSNRGGFVAFYAAQTTETTPEMPLPANLPPGNPNRKPYGLFGFTLAEALASVEGVSYRQLGQYVLQRYAALGMNAPTPLFSGTQLDAPIFGSAGGNVIRQWPIDTTKGISIQAGLLNQVTEGTVLAVVPGALAKSEEAIAYVKVDKAEALSASLNPVAHADKPLLSTLPAGAHARLLAPQVSFALRYIAPARTTSSATTLAAIEVLQRARSGVELRTVTNGQEHDLRLHVEDGALWLIPPTGQLFKDGPNKTISIKIDQPEFADKLADSMRRIGKALNLMRISAQLGGSGNSAGGVNSNLEVGLTALRKGQTAVPLNLAAVQAFNDGDEIEVAVKNKGRVALDLTALYIDAEYGISSLFPSQSGTNNRLEAGAQLSFKVEIHDDTVGLERLVLIAVEARAGSDRYDFSFMAQAKLERTRGTERTTGGADDEVVDIFKAAGFGADEASAMTTRGARTQTPSRTQMQVFPFRVQAKK